MRGVQLGGEEMMSNPWSDWGRSRTKMGDIGVAVQDMFERGEGCIREANFAIKFDSAVIFLFQL